MSPGSLLDEDTPPSQGSEPIAIVGIGCRWPGGVRSPSELWHLLKEKRDGYSEFSPDRINMRGFYHPDGQRPGSIHALEHFSGTKTGVFIGNFNNEHQTMQYRDSEHTPPYVVTGGGPTILSNRISYVFNLQGSSLVVDTACSASMYALHLAVLSIRNGDCSGAIVAGANVILGPDNQIFTTKLGAVSPTSRCHTFDVAADGYARAEGFGALYLKKLTDAVADGDPIRALIRGTAFNANGRTGGISHPSPDGQENVIRQAYQNAGNLNPDLTGYMECHGTGTPVGDPIEVSAIGRVFHAGRANDPLLIGSIKPNLGHSEAASAMSQVMKAILAMEHGEIPATIGINKFNPAIDFEGARVKVVTDMTPWPTNLLRRVSINSFGYGGANAHCVLDHPSVVIPGYQLRGFRLSSPSSISMVSPSTNGFTNGYSNDRAQGKQNDQASGHRNFNSCDSSTSWCIPAKAAQVEQAGVRPFVVLPLSAHDERALKSIISAISASLRDFNLADLLYTLSCRRSTFSHRAFAITGSRTLLKGFDSSKLTYGKAPSAPANRIGFIFTGQGAQRPQMGRDLLPEYAVFRQTIKYLDNVLSRLRRKPDQTIEEVLLEPAATSKINDPAFSQTVCTALQIALVALLRHWGISPVATTGHSSGEIAASYAAGRLKASEAIVLAYLRGQVVAANQKHGLMLAVGLGSNEVQCSLEGFEEEVKIAAVNSPSSVTLSGEPECIELLSQKFADRGVFARVLKTGGKAYHSHHMLALGAAYEDQATEGLKDIEAITEREPVMPVLTCISSVTTQKQVESPHPGYWRQNLESPVLFSSAIERLAKEEPLDLLVEVGPHPALGGPLKQIRASLEKAGIMLPHSLASLRRGEHDVVSMLTLAGNLFVNNAPVDLAFVNATELKTEAESHSPILLHHGFQCIDLFQYPYSYPKVPVYFENRFNKEYRTRKHPRHDLLGARVPAGSKKHPQWRNVLRLKDLPWLNDHKLIPHTVLPGAAYIAMAVEAVTQLYYDEVDHADVQTKIKSFKLRRVAINSTLNIEDTELGVETVLNMQKVALTDAPLMSQWYRFSIGSIAPNNDVWTEHCTGAICAMITDNSIAEDQKLKPDPRSRSLDMKRWHHRFNSVGLGYGPTFQGLSNLQAYRASNVAAADVALKPAVDSTAESMYAIHPATLDTCIQLALIACHAGQVESLGKAFVPVSADEVTIWNSEDYDAKQALGVASGSLVGLRSMHARVQLHSHTSKAPLLDTGELKCVTYDGVPDNKDPEIVREPYWRPVMRIDSNTLTTRNAGAIFHPEKFSATNLVTLDTLAAHVVTGIEEDFRKGHMSRVKAQSHDRFFQWIKASTSSPAREDVSGVASKAERIAIVERLTTELHDIPEAKYLKTLYDNVHRVFAGETNSLKLLMEGNMLTELFGSGLFVKGAYIQLKHLTSLLAHKNPRMRILEVGAGSGGATMAALEALSAESPFKRFEKYVFTDSASWWVSDAKMRFSTYGPDLTFQTLDVLEDPISQGFEEHSFDLIIAAGCLIQLSNLADGLEHLRTLLKPLGSLVVMETVRSALAPELLSRTLTGKWNEGEHFLNTARWDDVLQKSGFSGVSVSLQDYAEDQGISTVILSRAQGLDVSTFTMQRSPDVYLVFRDNHPPLLAETIAAALSKEGRNAILIDLLSSHKISSDALVISLVDLDGSTITCRDETYFKSLKMLVLQASGVVWVASDLHSPAESSIMKGMLRSIAVENILSKYCFVEIDHNYFTPQARAAELILTKLDELHASLSSDVALEAETVLRGDFFCVERLLPEERLSEEYRRRHRFEDVVQECAVGEQGPLMARYSQPGLLSSLYFSNDPNFSETLGDDWIEIKTEAIGLNMKDLAVATARFDLNELSTEAAGIVTRVGSAVKSLKGNDRVFGVIPGNMGNFLQSPASLVAKVPDRFSAEGAASMPVVYLTSIYALHHLAHLGKGESVLIQSATGGLGMAAIQLSQHLGAEIFATVGNAQKRRILIEEFGIPPSHIFDSRRIETVDEIMKATQRKGIDVILSAAGGDLMHEMWKCIAPLGRFIDVGRTDVLGGGRLGLEVFKRNATFSSFDIGLIYRQKPCMIQRLMIELNELVDEGIIGPIKHLTSFDISRLESAISTFSKGLHTGKLIITFKEPKATLRVLRPAGRATFDPNAAYLLVGCLRGLGRSVAAWMVERGARHPIFFSRSGINRPEAASTERELAEMGAKPQVIQCDITDPKALALAMNQVAGQLPVRGILHAAMVEGDSFFSDTSLPQIQSVLAPKVIGTINLHEATKHLELDFFLMISSIIGSVGTPSQGAYAAANAFQDAFARFRISQSLPATALDLGLILEVGSVSNAVGFQQMLRRNATYGISETEFLQLFEGALCEPKLSGQDSILSILDPSCPAQVITGLEPARFIPSSKNGRARDLVWFNNIRFQLVAQAISERARARNPAAENSRGATSYRSRLEEAPTPEEKLSIVREAIGMRIAELLSLTADDVDFKRPISSYGVDSLVAGELRNWLIRTFTLEVSLLYLLDQGTKLESLVKIAAGLDSQT